jgi:hypothetical protein
MKITEKMLLNGVNGITNGGDYISIVRGVEIRWNYRSTDDWGRPETVCEIPYREVITLEWDRTGVIPISHANDNHPGLRKIEIMEQKLWGASV